MLFGGVRVLKKKLGLEAIEICYRLGSRRLYFKIPSSLTIPEGCVRIGNWAFNGCYNLKEVKIPESVERLGYATFMDCKNLGEIKISASVKIIEGSAFKDCKKLREVVIPGSVEEVWHYVFYGCTDTDIILRKHKSEFKHLDSTAFFSCRNVKEEIRN